MTPLRIPSRKPVGAYGLVQVIEVSWTKASRGGEGARRRNAVPMAMYIGGVDLEPAGRLWVSIDKWDEKNTFARPATILRKSESAEDGFQFGCIDLRMHSEGLLCECRYGSAGASGRRYSDLSTRSRVGRFQSLVISPGSWARVCYNGRFSDTDTSRWYYHQTTINVAWLVGQPDERLFLDTRPTHDMRALAELW